MLIFSGSLDVDACLPGNAFHLDGSVFPEQPRLGAEPECRRQSRRIVGQLDFDVVQLGDGGDQG